MDAQLSEFTRKHWIVYLKRVYYMVCELYFNTIIKEKKSRYWNCWESELLVQTPLGMFLVPWDLKLMENSIPRYSPLKSFSPSLYDPAEEFI